MPKFELTLVHRLDSGIAKSVNKIEAESLRSLNIQWEQVIESVMKEVIEDEEIEGREPYDNFPF